MSRTELLPPALSGDRRDLIGRSGRLSYYAATGGRSLPPLLLLHSINAAGSAYEVRPLYERYRTDRPVYALELPGFGFSERSARRYTPRLMTDAVHDMIAEIQRREGGGAIDALALSLSCEFLARTAIEEPAAFRTIALVSPTGFDRRGPYREAPGRTRGMPWLYTSLNAGGNFLYGLLTTRVSIGHFLKKTWGSDRFDRGLQDYDYRTTHQPGARHAPYDFVSGFLFSKDITRVYEQVAMPVWMAHGVRGDFTDYSNKAIVQHRPNWDVDVFKTGALPHFEELEEVVRAYDKFLSHAAST